jgi:hypothetical protein
MHHLRYVSLALLFILSAHTAFADDPFDPLMGPRNPRPAATAYLKTRIDVPTSEQYNLLNNHPVTVSILQLLADAPQREIRALVAANANTPLAILDTLSKDKDSAVRQYVADNKTIPPDLLERLSHDKDKNVRWSAQHNPLWAPKP